jgi:hypothetical protein
LQLVREQWYVTMDALEGGLGRSHNMDIGAVTPGVLYNIECVDGEVFSVGGMPCEWLSPCGCWFLLRFGPFYSVYGRL